MHRNTVSYFLTGRFATTPESITAMKKALETAGVEFIGKTGVKLKR